MDRDMEMAHLVIAEKAVAEGERHIVLEEQRIADLDRHGHDTKLALATLAVFRKMQAEHVAHRNLLVKILGQNAARLLPDGPIFQPGNIKPAEPE